MKITGKEGGPIERAMAKRWTANYRRAGRGKVRSHLFGVETIQQILAQDGCVGIKAYYALDDDGQEQLLLVGTDADGNELQDGVIMDKSRACPPDCDSAGELDS